MIKQISQRLPDPQVRIIDADGKLTTVYYQYLRELDAKLRQVIDKLNVEFP